MNVTIFGRIYLIFLLFHVSVYIYVMCTDIILTCLSQVVEIII
jgi:hypothetical protein